MKNPVVFLTVPIFELRKNTFNTNQVSPENESKIRRSLERNGMFKPVIVRQVPDLAGYEIIGGEHRWEQAVELGHAEVPIANLGFITEIQAKEIGVIDNARYGADDTLSFAELLKELGDIGDLQEFLPYGESDLDTIFASSSIDLDSLEIDENFEKDAEPVVEAETPATKAPKTHTIMRFKIPLGDAERLTRAIAQTQKDQGLTTSDDLTNAGDALIHLLSDQLAPVPTPVALVAPKYILDDIAEEATK